MKKILTVVLVILLLFLIASCSASGTRDQDIIRIGDETGDWGFPSPYGMYFRGPGYIRMSLLFDTLIWKDKQGQFMGMLADSWDYNEQQNVFTFNLRQDVKWHDGQAFDASDVVFTFNYIKQHPWVWVDSSCIDSVKKTGDFSVEIVLAKKYAPFLANIAGTLPVLPEHIWKDIEDPFNYSTEDALTGTGPFTLADYSPSEGSYLFEANQDYYGGKVNIDSIAFVKVVPETSASMLQSNNIDAAAIPADIADDTQQKGFILEQEPPVWAAKLLINHENHELLVREPARQALAYAINLEQVVEISQRGFAVKGSSGLMPPANSLWYNPEIFQYEFDSEKAKKILEEHGYQLKQDGYYYSGDRILKLELAVSQGDFERDAQIIKSNLEEAGIKIDLISYEGKTLDSKIENWDFDLAISGHGGLGGDPEALNRVITGQDFNSVRYFKDEHLINLLEAQVQEMDIRKRRQMVYQIQDLYSRHLPSITLYYPQWYWAHNRKADIFFTPGGIALGIPLPLNKIAFIDY